MSALAPASPAPEVGAFVLIEDDPLLRDLLERALRLRFAPRTFHAFANGEAGLAHCLANPPDLLITDLRLPGVDGRDIIRRLQLLRGSTRFVVLTGHVSPTLPTELIALGVAGFIDKASQLESIERAIERVLAGGLYFSTHVSPANLTYLPTAVTASGPSPQVLTEREREISRMVAGGLFSKEIGARLGLSPRTVEKQRRLIMAKLGTPNLPALIRWCVRHGLI